MNKRLAAVLSLSLLAALLVACHASTSEPASGGMARIHAAGVLRWGGDLQGGEPYVYEDPNRPGTLIGFEVDLAEAIARELGVKAEFQQNDWSNLVPSLERGSFDVVMNGLEVTPTRVGRILFSRPYYVFAERLMARKGDTRIQPSLAALRGLKVGTLANSYAFDLLRAELEPVLYEGTEEPYADLAEGRTDAVLMDDIIAARYGEPKPGLVVVGDVAEGYYAIGVRKTEPDVKGALDQALERIAARGDLRRILERWKLWSDREQRLVGWTERDQATMTGQAPPAAAMTWGHALLFVKGAGVTLLVSALAMALAVSLGMGLALARMLGPTWLRPLAAAYVELYRGTPVLLQLYVIYYGLAPIVKLSALTAAVVGLGMNYAAYEAEVYRAGIQAVPRGQWDAAFALGMTTSLTLRRIVLPQAFRLALPNVTNDFIAMIKDSSLVSVITVVELTKQMTITSVDVRSWLLPGLLCAALYFAMSYPLARKARALEAALERS